MSIYRETICIIPMTKRCVIIPLVVFQCVCVCVCITMSIFSVFSSLPLSWIVMSWFTLNDAAIDAMIDAFFGRWINERRRWMIGRRRGTGKWTGRWIKRGRRWMRSIHKVNTRSMNVVDERCRWMWSIYEVDECGQWTRLSGKMQEVFVTSTDYTFFSYKNILNHS